jgi:hypothetical protein
MWGSFEIFSCPLKRLVMDNLGVTRHEVIRFTRLTFSPLPVRLFVDPNANNVLATIVAYRYASCNSPMIKADRYEQTSLLTRQNQCLDIVFVTG